MTESTIPNRDTCIIPRDVERHALQIQQFWISPKLSFSLLLDSSLARLKPAIIFTKQTLNYPSPFAALAQCSLQQSHGTAVAAKLQHS